MSLRSCLVVVALTTSLGLGVFAQQKSIADKMEGEVKSATFGFYSGAILGNAESYLKATRFPLVVWHDGTMTTRSEKQAKEILAAASTRFKARNLDEKARQQLVGKLIGQVEDASVEYLGADTVHVSIVVSAGPKDDDGESLIGLLLHRKSNKGTGEPKWEVVEEVTDGKAVPPAYVKG